MDCKGEIDNAVPDATPRPRFIRQTQLTPSTSDRCHTLTEAGYSPAVVANPSPSPVSKKLTGVSSNARNDIYLKTLLNSPYHKAYSPAHNAGSPTFKTPIRSRLGSPGPEVTSTPQGPRAPPGSDRKFVTPRNLILNPFEGEIDDLMAPAYMSPGLFTLSSTPASDEKKPFRWSIEHIAQLHPADIDEMPNQVIHVRPDKETEERAQRAIDQFFANNLIAPSPSPWGNIKNQKKVLTTPQTGNTKDKAQIMTELEGSIQKQLPNTSDTQDVCCQTVLTLPVSFDLQKVLSAYMTYEAHEDSGNQEMLSTSSLRRKLFFHGDTSSLAPSPVKGVREEGLCEPMSSPLLTKHVNPDWTAHTPLKTTPAFSSSPIKRHTPKYRRCSSDPEFLASPELSPIVQGNLPSSVRKSQSSGIFEHVSFNLSPDDDNEVREKQMSGSPVSPIPFVGTTPPNMEAGVDFQPKFVDSPGFSPIRSPKTPIRKTLRRSQEESYIQDDLFGSDEEAESITPVSAQPQHLTRTPVPDLSPIHKTPKQRHASQLLRSHSLTDLQHTAMEFETVPNSENIRFTDNIMTSSMCDTRDFSVSNMEFPDETHRGNMTSQDTGYQTSSLQSTNPDAALHTNLTSQFNSLPFNLTNQESAFQTSVLLANQDKGPVTNVANQFMSVTDKNIPETEVSERRPVSKNLFREHFYADDSALPEEMGHMFFSHLDKQQGQWVGKDSVANTEIEVLSRARQALAMANSSYSRTNQSQSITEPSVTKDTIQSTQAGESASDIALTLIRRAEEDLARYAPLLPTPSSTDYR